MESNFEFIVASSGERLDAFLSREAKESREFVQEQVRQGLVSVNGRPTQKNSLRLRPGDTLRGRFVAPPPLEIEARPGNLEILFEDDDLLVLNKPQGIAVHPAPGLRADTLVHHLLHHLQHSSFSELSPVRPGIVHRLDIGTSGLLLVAKNRHSQDKLAKQFAEREIQKQYEAIVWGHMGQLGRFDSKIGRHVTDRKRMSSRTEQGREALTRWERICLLGPCFTHVRLFPHTGRTHQLRVHLTEAGFPIVGDPLYVRRAAAGLINKLDLESRNLIQNLKYPFLHARRLEFTHPKSGEALVFEKDAPENFQSFLASFAQSGTLGK
ncbi:MAG: RluA family pseudouridine synthase [Bdellovibrionales bacterium]|nr:RluA family pseudouridine synthase [Bdellovibrionales bacterium]